MDFFVIEYAKMRQKELDKDIQAINLARLARSRDSNHWYAKALIEVGHMISNLGQRLTQVGGNIEKNYGTTK